MYPLNPDRNKPWNELPELPLQKEMFYTQDVLEQLGDAKASLARLQGRSAALPNQGILIQSISLQEAKDSSEIENIFTTHDELYRAYSDGKTETPGPAREVLRYREALWTGVNYLQERGKFDIGYFIQMYQEIKQTTDGIRPPFLPTVIVRGGSGPLAGRVVYTPPRGKGVIEGKLENLMAFLNDESSKGLDPLLKVAIGHLQFEAIHPFRDGNGRTGRVFNIHYLTHMGLLDTPILYLSRYIIQNKDEYYRRLAAVSQQGDWINWILYMLTAIEVTSRHTFNKINDILSVRDAILQEIKQATDIQRPEQLVSVLFTQPFSKVRHFTEQQIYAENTARNYLNQLSTMGILEKKLIQGNHYYLNLELHRILAE
jgi:Fic family protein